MKRFITLLFLFICTAIISLFSNNLVISTPTLVDQNTTEHYFNVRFDISWENSWRTSSAPNNWDAVWLFVKYKKASDGNWYHATLNSISANHSTGSQGTEATINIPDGAKGGMYYRSTDGEGTFASEAIKFRWEYGIDGISDSISSAISDIKVFGVEMVYVPQDTFYVGSGGYESQHFYSYGSNSPYLISSEDSIIVEPTLGNLWADDDIEQSIIPASFPKGFNSFYCMKHEISQEQYAGFINTLTATQQNNRLVQAFGWYGFSLKKINGIVGSDANNNNIINEFDDGQNIACFVISWADGCAYADWSGLSLMTELEYEKSCRGPLTPIPNEYAWGSTYIFCDSVLEKQFTNQEEFQSNISNCNYYNGKDLLTRRVGIFAKNNTDRVQSGAGYYGALDLSGNLYERIVTIADSMGRQFTGLSGDGILDNNGNANVQNWPGLDAIGSGFRGGSWNFYNGFCMTSSRELAGWANTDRWADVGFRCIIRM